MLTSMKGQLVSEAHLAIPNGTSGRCNGDEVDDFVTRNCLIMGDYPITRTGMRQAIEDGYASVITERSGRIVMIDGIEGASIWEDAHTNIGVSFPVNRAESAFLLTSAKDDDGDFVVDAVSTDGGYFPRNFAVEKTLAMVRFGALTPLELVAKVSWNPSRMFGLVSKGHLSPDADADLTIVDPATGKPTMGIVGGDVVMLDGNVVGTGGTILVTEHGESAAKDSGLDYEIVDLQKSKLYEGWS